MSRHGLDYSTRRRIRDFIRLNMAEPLTAKQVAIHFRLRPDDEPDIQEILAEVAILGSPASRPEVRTPPAEVLDILVAVVAEQSLADYRTGNCLRSCRFCRNSLLYLLDTAPYSGDARQSITARLQFLHVSHDLSHQNQAAADHGDARHPRIRWIAP